MRPDPTWQDRLGTGNEVPDADLAKWIAIWFPDWRGIHILATILAEHGGEVREWQRPMVWDPDGDAHLSTDRGVCQFNSFWWAHVPDRVAYDPAPAVNEMCAALEYLRGDLWSVNEGLRFWTTFRIGAHKRYLGRALQAMEQETGRDL